MKCPDCKKPVLRVERTSSTVVYVHAIGDKPAMVYGCTRSSIPPKGSK